MAETTHNNRLVALCVALAVLLILTIAAVLAGGGKDQKALSFGECVALSGSRTQESSPRVCVTPSGQRFVEDVASDLPKQVPVDGALDINEWGIRLSTQEKDAYYKINSDGTIYVSTKTLDTLVGQVQGCRSGLGGITIHRDLTQAAIITTMCVPQVDPAQQDKMGVIKARLISSLTTPQQITNICANQPELSADCAKAYGNF